MTTSLPSPPSTPKHYSPESENEQSLVEHLDELLEKYLEALDTYTTLRAQLSQEFSSGFFSLAQANRNSTLGPGRRYGEEGYDERMKATRLLHIAQAKPAYLRPLQNHEDSRNIPGDAQLEDDDSVGEKKSEVLKKKLDTPSRNKGQKPDCKSSDVPKVESFEYTMSTPLPAELTTDANTTGNPLRWYGLFVPSALRQTQKHFIMSATGTIPQLVTAISTLEVLETAIYSLRSKLPIVDQDPEATQAGDPDHYEANAESGEKSQAKFDHKHSEVLGNTATKEPAKSPSYGKRNSIITNRQAELRPRVLKLD